MKKIGKFWLVAILSLVVIQSYGQPDPPPDDDSVPIDGGVGLLVAVGAAWGIKKLKEKK